MMGIWMSMSTRSKYAGSCHAHLAKPIDMNQLKVTLVKLVN